LTISRGIGRNWTCPRFFACPVSSPAERVIKYWDNYYAQAGKAGDDLADPLTRLRQQGFTFKQGEAAAINTSTKVITYGPSTKVWELYEESIHYSVSKGVGKDWINEATKQLRTSFYQRGIRRGSPAAAAEEIYVKKQLLLRLDLDAPTRELLEQQIKKLYSMGMNGGY
jgi:Neuraminidase (sialidase)